MQGVPLYSPCQPAFPRTKVSLSHRESYRRPSIYSLSLQSLKRTLPKHRLRHVAARAETGASSEGPLESIAAWWRSVTGQGGWDPEHRRNIQSCLLILHWLERPIPFAIPFSGSAPEKTVEQAKEKESERVKEKVLGAQAKSQQQSSSGKRAVGAAAETASSTPLKPYPKVADTKHAAPNNGVKRPATVSASTQTDAIKAPKRHDGSESASWDPAGAAQAEWDEADQSSKPGLLGVLLPLLPSCVCKHLSLREVDRQAHGVC